MKVKIPDKHLVFYDGRFLSDGHFMLDYRFLLGRGVPLAVGIPALQEAIKTFKRYDASTREPMDLVPLWADYLELYKIAIEKECTLQDTGLTYLKDKVGSRLFGNKLGKPVCIANKYLAVFEDFPYLTTLYQDEFRPLSPVYVSALDQLVGILMSRQEDMEPILASIFKTFFSKGDPK